MPYIIATIAGYFAGCINTAYIISRIKGVDLRKGGSGNLGASNTTILLGWKLGVLVGVIDILKGVVTVLVFQAFFSEHPAVWLLSGTACILGHIFPFYLRFRGGKGFATILGVITACDWRFAIAIGILILLITWITDYIVLATTTTVLAFPMHMALTTHSLIPVLVVMPATLVILYKHLPNLKRIFLGGGEIGFRSTAEGEHRIDR